MRFLVDECTGPVVAQWLRSQQHDVFSVYEQARGLEDDAIIQKAFEEDRILITNDKDFGEQVYREHRPHHGIVLLRLDDERSQNKRVVLQKLLDKYSDQIYDRFVVVSENAVRFGK